jgi:hypothetical protein
MYEMGLGWFYMREEDGEKRRNKKFQISSSPLNSPLSLYRKGTSALRAASKKGKVVHNRHIGFLYENT